MAEKQQPSTLRQQAEFLDYIVARCTMSDGKLAGEATITLTQSDAEELHQMAMRLHRMSIYETEIRRVVTRR
jgi:hypothetical protein